MVGLPSSAIAQLLLFQNAVARLIFHLSLRKRDLYVCYQTAAATCMLAVRQQVVFEFVYRSLFFDAVNYNSVRSTINSQQSVDNGLIEMCQTLARIFVERSFSKS